MSATKKGKKALRREISNLLPLFLGIGSRFAARFLPVEIYEESFEVNVSATELNEFVSRKLSNAVRFTDEFADEQKTNSFSMFIGSGSRVLNPTIVHLTIALNLSKATVLNVKALAKEGSVKQNSAKKAVETIKNLLLSSEKVD
jgi:hypothetical protein